MCGGGTGGELVMAFFWAAAKPFPCATATRLFFRNWVSFHPTLTRGVNGAL